MNKTVEECSFFSGGRKSSGVEVESRTALPLKVVAFEIGKGTNIETAVLLSGIGRDNGGRPSQRCDYL